jgi:hypothetical protein
MIVSNLSVSCGEMFFLHGIALYSFMYCPVGGPGFMNMGYATVLLMYYRPHYCSLLE